MRRPVAVASATARIAIRVRAPSSTGCNDGTRAADNVAQMIELDDIRGD